MKHYESAENTTGANLMKKLCSFLIVTVAVMFAATANANWVSGDGTNPVVNPDSQLALIPNVNYEPDTGIIWIDTLGTNGVNDTLADPALQGDDVGMVSFQIESSAMQLEFLLNGFVDNMVWSGTYFADKVQMFGIAAGREFVEPSGRIDLVRMPTGLDASNFGAGEIGVNFSSTVAGEILFNNGTHADCPPINIVPEPCGLGIAGILVLGLIFGYRRV